MVETGTSFGHPITKIEEELRFLILISQKWRIFFIYDNIPSPLTCKCRKYNKTRRALFPAGAPWLEGRLAYRCMVWTIIATASAICPTSI